MIARADLGGGVITTIVSVIGGFFGIFRGKTSLGVKLALEAMRKRTMDVGRELANFIGDVRGWLPALVGLLKRLRTNVLLPLFQWLSARIRWLRAWLKRIFGPLLKVLWRLRKELLEFYTKYIRPILDVIEVLRFITSTLGRLGVKWAAALDARLAQIESAITVNFQKILSTVNRVTSTLNSIVTLELLFQRVPFLASLRRDLPQWAEMFWRAQVRPLTAAQRARLREAPETPTVQERAEETRVLLERGDGPAAARLEEMVTTMRNLLDSLPQR